jgi:hypothetical protein
MGPHPIGEAFPNPIFYLTGHGIGMVDRSRMQNRLQY